MTVVEQHFMEHAMLDPREIESTGHVCVAEVDSVKFGVRKVVGWEDYLGLREVGDQAAQVCTAGEESGGKHLFQNGTIFFDECRLSPTVSKRF